MNRIQVAAGMAATAEKVCGGYSLAGHATHWRLVSGISGAVWFIAPAVTNETERNRANPMHDIRLCVPRRDQISINRKQNFAAMPGSGSHDVIVQTGFIPGDLMTPPLDMPPRLDRPLYRAFPSIVFPGGSAVLLGAAEAAIDEIHALAALKQSRLGGTLANSVRAQYVIDKAEADLAGARLLLHSAAESLQATTTEDSGVFALQRRAALRAARTHASETIWQVLVAIYQLSRCLSASPRT